MRNPWMLGGIGLALSGCALALDLSAMPPAETHALLAQWRVQSPCVDQTLETASDPADCASEFASVALLKARVGDLPDAERHWRRAIEWAVRDAKDGDDAWSEVGDLGLEALVFLRSFALDTEALRLIDETRATMQQLGWSSESSDALLDLVALGPQIRSGQVALVQRRFRSVISALTMDGEPMDVDERDGRDELISHLERLFVAISPLKLTVAADAEPLTAHGRRRGCVIDIALVLLPTQSEVLRARGLMDAAIDAAIRDANDADPGNVDFQVLDLMLARHGEDRTRALLDSAAASIRSKADGEVPVSTLTLLGHQIQLIDVIETQSGADGNRTSQRLSAADQRARFLSTANHTLNDVLEMRAARAAAPVR